MIVLLSGNAVDRNVISYSFHFNNTPFPDNIFSSSVSHSLSLALSFPASSLSFSSLFFFSPSVTSSSLSFYLHPCLQLHPFLFLLSIYLSFVSLFRFFLSPTSLPFSLSPVTFLLIYSLLSIILFCYWPRLLSLKSPAGTRRLPDRRKLLFPLDITRADKYKHNHRKTRKENCANTSWLTRL